MIVRTALVLALYVLFLSASQCSAGANNNTPHDAFESYQTALRDQNVALLLEVYFIKDAYGMSDSRLRDKLRELKNYDGYKNYGITQILEEGKDEARVKVKGTLRGTENVRRTFKLKRFNDGWKITYVWNS
jgi:hypothetical protein